MSSKIIKLLQGYGIDLEPFGDKFRTNCPLPGHQDDTPSFFVYPLTDSFFCFGCHKGGDCLKFTMMYEGLSRTQALEKLGVKQDATQEVLDILEPTKKEETTYNIELNYIIGSLMRPYLQKIQDKSLILGWLKDIDKQLVQRQLAEGDAKSIINDIQNKLKMYD